MATSIGVPGSATYAELLSGLEPMLNLLPDNTGNEISARDMRDVVFTLYQDAVVGGTGGSFSEFVYTDTPATVAVGGIPLGQTFASMSLFTIFNKLFHKDFDPSAGLQFVGLSSPILDFKQQGSTEYPQNTGFDETVSYQLRWTANKATYDFLPNGTIVRNPLNSPPDPNPLFNINVPPGGGTDLTPQTKPRINVANSYTFTCRDTRNVTAQSSVSLSYGHRVYWGKRTNRNALTSSDIRNLDGAGVSGNGNFRSLTFTGNVTTGAKLSFPNINGSGQYLCWAWPSSFGNPVFRTATGIVAIAEKIQSGFPYRNLFGFEHPYDIWVTYITYNSPIAQLDLF